MTPTDKETASQIAFASSVDHQGEEAGLRGWQEEQINKALKAKDLRYQEMVGKLGRVRESLYWISGFYCLCKTNSETKCWNCIAREALTLLSEIMKDA